MQEEQISSISVLPEGCIAKILSFTSPRDACSSASVCSEFRDAADSDDVWDKFLPSDYEHLLSKSPLINLADFSSKKQLYQRLCGDPVLLEGGNKSLNLEKKSGNKCITVGARELTIVWGDTLQYWTWTSDSDSDSRFLSPWTSDSDSRFAETAQLLSVCWFEISCRINTGMLSPKTAYVAYLLIKNSRRTGGFDYPPAEVTVGFVERAGSASAVRNIYLTRPKPNMFFPRPQAAISEDVLPHKREDGWMEIEIGEFYNDQGEDGEVQMTVQEVKGGHWKSGLIVEGIELRPKASIR